MKINGVLEGGLLENRADVGDNEAKKIGRVTVGQPIISPFGGAQIAPIYIGKGDFISRVADLNELSNVRSTLMNEDARLQQSIEVVSGAVGLYRVAYSLGEDISDNLQITGIASKSHPFPQLAYLFPSATTRTITYSSYIPAIEFGLPIGNKYEISADVFVGLGGSATTGGSMSPVFVRFPKVAMRVGSDETFSSTLGWINGFSGKSSEGLSTLVGPKRRSLVALSNGTTLYGFELREYDLDASTYTVVKSGSDAYASLSFSLQTMDPNVLVAFGSGVSMNLILTRVQ